MNILVVEDNQYEMNNIIRTLKSISEEFNIYKACTGKECFKILQKIDIDLFLLDIELPGISGIKIAEKIRGIPKYELTYMVFITTHIQLQLDAFKKIHCYDFIEKPYRREELVEIIKRLAKGISSQKQQNKPDKQQVSFQMKDFILKIDTNEILFVEAQGRNSIIHTRHNTHTIKSMTLKKVREILPREHFMQTHRSYIISLEKIQQIKKEEKNSWIVYFKEYDLLAHISNSYKKEFSDRFFH